MDKSYIIVTPVYNEERLIEKTLKSVISQSALPLTWIIVDDESTDRSADIIKYYAPRYSWIKYLYRRKDRNHSYYASNVCSILDGVQFFDSTIYDYLAILDADISLPPDYYEKLICLMEKDTQIGIASGVFLEECDGKYVEVLHDRRSTPKALMVFRKKCYEEIGGLLPMQYGGEDTIACFMARMNNWKTWSFPELLAVHNRPVGNGLSNNILKIRFQQGVSEYFSAAHPIFVFIKYTRRCFLESPFLFGGLARMAGYIKGAFMPPSSQIPEKVFRYIRKEQLRRVLSGNRIPAKYRVEITSRENLSVTRN